MEEIGVSPQPLGCGSDVPAMSGMVVTPVIGVIDEPLPSLSVLRPNPAEVASVFSLSLAHLLDPKNREQYVQPIAEVGPGRPHPRGGMKLNAFLGGPQRIWGLTAYVLDVFLRDVISPSVFKDLTVDQRIELGVPPNGYGGTQAHSIDDGKARITVVAAAEQGVS